MIHYTSDYLENLSKRALESSLWPELIASKMKHNSMQYLGKLIMGSLKKNKATMLLNLLINSNFQGCLTELQAKISK